MNEEINISILLPSRERPLYLRRSILSLDILSAYPEKIEYLLWVDEDDLPSKNMVNKLRKEVKNIRVFVCPRMGYFNIWFMVEKLLEHSKGKIILPFGDDCFMKELYWDDKMMKYSEEEAFIGWKTRFGFTVKLLNKIDIINLWKQHTNKICEFIRDNYSIKYMKPMKAEWFGIELVRPNIRFKSRTDETKLIPDNFNILNYEQKNNNFPLDTK